jgi:hypothetical protein
LTLSSNTATTLDDGRDLSEPKAIHARQTIVARVANISPDNTTTSASERRAEQAAAHIGLQAGEVERLPFDLSALEQDGIFTNVDARNFGLLDRRVDWDAMGIALPTQSDLAFRPPRCGVVPDAYRLPLLRPAARAHAALHRYSYRFQLVETVFETVQYRWVPWRAWPEFERAFTAAREQLRRVLEQYESNYPAIRDQVLGTFAGLATDSARRLSATGQAVPVDFEASVVEGAVASLPTPELLGEHLSLRFKVGVIHLGSEFLNEQRRAAEERRQLEAVQVERRQLHHRAQAETALVQEQLWAEQRRLRLQVESDERERRNEEPVRERIRQLKLEAAKERLSEALSPLDEGAQQLCSAVFEAASIIRASLQKHGALRGTSAKKARQLGAWFRLVNWQNDTELEQLVTELERLASAPSGKNRKRDPQPIDRVLGEIIEMTYAAASSAAEPTRMGALEL